MSTDCCMACEESAIDAPIHLPCGEHTYCTDCLRAAVQVAVHDEQYYPLACGATECSPIQDQTIYNALSEQDPDLVDNFLAKAQEYKESPDRRTYCANTECISVQGHSRHLPYDTHGSHNKVMCPDCSRVTCCLCKCLIVDGTDHKCEETTQDQSMRDYIDSLPEDSRWLSKQCPSCGAWIEKSSACNHMTCTCSAEFCLICGRQWEGLASCRWGCPKNDAPVYDDEGYNQHGFHPETGLNSDGIPWDPNQFHDDNGGYGDDEEEDTEDDDDDDDNEADRAWDFEPRIFGEDGFDQWGRDADGFDQAGYDERGYDREGFDREGFNVRGWNNAGYDRNGLDRTGRDANLFFEDGYNMDGFDVNGMSLRGIHRDMYDEEGYDPSGVDVFGFSRAGFDEDGYDADGISQQGFDHDGFDSHGYNANGYDIYGYNRYDINVEGLRRSGYTQHHRDPNDKDSVEPGYHIALDGNVRRDVDEGPSTAKIECQHNASFRRGSATCMICRWTSDYFYHRCDTCGAKLCRACDHTTAEDQLGMLRGRYLWPGRDSFGIAEMFERFERV